MVEQFCPILRWWPPVLAESTFSICGSIKIKTQFKFAVLIALLFTALAFLLKPYALFFTLPMVYLVLERFGLSFGKNTNFGFLQLFP